MMPQSKETAVKKPRKKPSAKKATNMPQSKETAVKKPRKKPSAKKATNMPQSKKTAVKKPRKKPSAKQQQIQEEIAKKAFELYEQSGREDGKDVEHWLEAEKLLKPKPKRKKSP